jgi:hypothetical protein
VRSLGRATCGRDRTPPGMFGVLNKETRKAGENPVPGFLM